MIFKKATGFDISNFDKKIDLASLKSEINKLGIGKLKTTPVGLSKVSCVVKNEVVKIILYDELVKKS